eukprot:PhF_6_TR27921/c0_g1_i3/m.41054
MIEDDKNMNDVFTVDPATRQPWRYRKTIVDEAWAPHPGDIVVRCLDVVVEGGDMLFLSSFPKSQMGRIGVYNRMPETFSNRPVFRRAVPEPKYLQTTHNQGTEDFLFYCPSTKEWVITEDPPFNRTYDIACTRGVASLPTKSSHPMISNTHDWRFWDDPTWKPLIWTDFSIRSYSIDALCPLVQLVHYPDVYPAAGLYTIIPNITWGGFPLYERQGDKDNSPAYLWYCHAIQEWGASPIDPRGFSEDRKNESCMRSISSFPTASIAPDLWEGQWNAWNGSSWRRGEERLNVRCVHGCPTIMVDGIEYSELLKEFSGLYSRLPVKFNNHPLYLRTLRAPMYMWFQEDRWVFTRQEPLEFISNEKKGSGDDEIKLMTERYMSHEEDTHDPLLKSSLVSNTDGSLKFSSLSLRCAYDISCRRFLVDNLPSGLQKYGGVYVAHKHVHGERFVFFLESKYITAHETNHGVIPLETPTIFYCIPSQRWTFGPYSNLLVSLGDHCSSWLSSQETGASHPGEVRVWEKYVQNKTWQYFPANLTISQRVLIRCMNTDLGPTLTPNTAWVVPLYSTYNVPHLHIENSSFVENNAMSTSGPAAGAVYVNQHIGHVGLHVVHALSRLTFHHNDAVGVHGFTADENGGGDMVSSGVSVSVSPSLPTWVQSNVSINLTYAVFEGGINELGSISLRGIGGLYCLECIITNSRSSSSNGGGACLTHLGGDSSVLLIRNSAMHRNRGGVGCISITARNSVLYLSNVSMSENVGAALQSTGHVTLLGKNKLKFTHHGIAIMTPKFVSTLQDTMTCVKGTVKPTERDGIFCSPTSGSSTPTTLNPTEPITAEPTSPPPSPPPPSSAVTESISFGLEEVMAILLFLLLVLPASIYYLHYNRGWWGGVLPIKRARGNSGTKKR